MAVRVHELAREFQVPSKIILEALKEIGEYTRSPSSTVQPPVVRKLRAHFDAPEYKGPVRRSAPPRTSPQRDPRFRPGNNPFGSRVGPAKRPSGESQVSKAARALGLDPHEVELTPVRSKRSRQQTPKHARDSWDEHFFSREDRAAWFAVGVDNPTTAMACITYGLQPDDLTLVVEGRAAWERLSGGNEPIAIVADMIKVEKRRFRESG